ncbi:MAG TPA: tetratricopeptide repeat protein, partial [Opitutaceae bacterium]|nr:tetratricopeptide repeat protein [Opitutaceae bacterium]
AALLWTLHPLQTESVTYIIQRAESLMGLLYLLTLYCFIRGAERQGPGPWFILSIGACLLGMATKEVMASAPLIVLLYDRTFIAGSFSEAWRRRRGVYAGLAATWLLLGFLILSAHGRGGTAGLGSGVSWWSYALTQFPAIVHYLRLSLLPHPLVLDYGTALETRALRIVPGLLFVAALLAATVWALFRRPALGFLGACFFMVLAPSSSIVPVATQTMAEHRMYLALAPVVVLVALGIFRWLGRAALPACLALAAALGVMTWQRNRAYLSEEGIWRDTAAKLPQNERAHNNLGFVLSTMPGRAEEAIAQYREALRLRPGYFQAHNNLGAALEKIPGRLDEAISHFEEAIRLRPDFADAHYNLGIALERVPGRANDAIAQYEEALRLRPGYADAHYNLGIALEGIPGRANDAVAQYEEALRLEPDMAQAHNNLGLALSAMPGRLDEAIAQYEEALRLEAGDAGVHVNLGIALARIPGRLGEAVGQYEEALRLKPDMAQAHNDLGLALSAMPGRLDDAMAHYQEALRLDPGFAQAHNNLGIALAQGPGRLDDAVAQFGEAVRLDPGLADAHSNLGHALSEMPGRLDDAVSQYREALRLNPGSAEDWHHLGVCLLNLGNLPEAASAFRQELRLSPDSPAGQQALAAVLQAEAGSR